MPLHDWTRVPSGIFHHFHQRWASAQCDALNGGLLPRGYYALLEQVAGGPIPDLLSFQHLPKSHIPPNGNGVALLDVPPRTRFIQSAQPEQFAAKANRVTIRHPLGNVVAVLEVVSPGNKESRHAVRAFVEKAVAFLNSGIHLSVIDLFPPTQRDPQGIHKAIWDEIRDEPFELPSDKPLTLVAYDALPIKTAYIEPVAVGDTLPDLPLFLEPGKHVLVPLEATYMTTWSLCPAPMREMVGGGVR
ncbi:MAG: DUF4058 family protein [Gemmataceae bacterium]|nr:DUF4058 family protein [Gemmataceae bacterium]